MNNSKLKYYTFASLFLVLIIDAMGIGLVLPLLGPLFISKTSAFVSAGISMPIRDLLYGLTMGIFCIFMFFGAPFLGDLSDHIGRKKTLLLCLFGTALGLIVSAVGINVHSIFLLVFGRAIAGFMAGSQAMAQAAIVDISTKENKTKNLSLISLASCIGFVLGPTMSGLTADKHLWSGFGLSTPFWLAAGLAFINGGMLLFTFRETFYFKGKQKLQLTKGLAIFISAFTNKTVRKLAIIFLLAEGGWALYFQFLPLHLIAIYHYSIAQIGHIMAWMGIVFGITFLLIVRIIEKYIKLEQIVYLTIGLTAVGILMALFKNEWLLWLSIIPASIGGALFYVGLLTLFSNTVDKNSQGWVMGVFAAIAAVSWTLGAVCCGLFGIISLAVPFVIAAGLLILAAVLVNLG